MPEYDLWKYCTSEQVKITLHSFDLLAGVPMDEEKELACLYAVSNHTEKHYQQVQIPKRKGGMRCLSVPDGLLCTIQKNILRHVLCEFSASEYATAYKKKTSVLDNASPHVGAEQIVKLDIKDFFENISFLLVYQYAFPAVHFPPAIRRMLTELCCYRDCLPQGAPTSPAVSNLVMKPFDEYMGEWCKERGIAYTRYCDDLTFSYKKGSEMENSAGKPWKENMEEDFSEGVEESGNSLNHINAKALIGKVRGFLHVYGFELNNKKTRVFKRNVRQSVTGIVVNEKPQVSREYRRNLRQEIYYCRKFGVESHLKRKYAGNGSHVDSRDKRNGNTENIHNNACASGKQVGISCQRYLQKLLGKISYVCLVNPGDKEFQEARTEVMRWMRMVN